MLKAESALPYLDCALQARHLLEELEAFRVSAIESTHGLFLLHLHARIRTFPAAAAVLVIKGETNLGLKQPALFKYIRIDQRTKPRLRLPSKSSRFR